MFFELPRHSCSSRQVISKPTDGAFWIRIISLNLKCCYTEMIILLFSTHDGDDGDVIRFRTTISATVFNSNDFGDCFQPRRFRRLSSAPTISVTVFNSVDFGDCLYLWRFRRLFLAPTISATVFNSVDCGDCLQHRFCRYLVLCGR